MDFIRKIKSKTTDCNINLVRKKFTNLIHIVQLLGQAVYGMMFWNILREKVESHIRGSFQLVMGSVFI